MGSGPVDSGRRPEIVQKSSPSSTNDKSPDKKVPKIGTIPSRREKKTNRPLREKRGDRQNPGRKSAKNRENPIAEGKEDQSTVTREKRGSTPLTSEE